MRKQTIIVAVVGMLVLLSLGCARKVRMTPSPAVPAAKAEVKIGSDQNDNTTVDLKVNHLALARNLSPPRSVYVVWFQPLDGAAENQGVLRVGEDRAAELKTATPYHSFDILVSAEDDPRARMPRGEVVLRQRITR